MKKFWVMTNVETRGSWDVPNQIRAYARNVGFVRIRSIRIIRVKEMEEPGNDEATVFGFGDFVARRLGIR